MKQTKTIPLGGMPNQRGYDSLATLIAGKDQRFRAAIVGLIQNPITQQSTLYLEKRPGFETFLTPASGSNGEMIFYSVTQAKAVGAFVTGGVTTVYVGTTSCGVTT